MNIDFIPDVIADSVPRTLSTVEDVIETIPDRFATGLSRTRRVIRFVTRVPGSRLSDRRWWFAAAGVAVTSALLVVWMTRRSGGDSMSAVTGSSTDESGPRAA